MSGLKSLITLAVVCLMAAPAYSMPFGDGHMGQGHGFGLPLVDLSEEEMNNMTLAELRDLEQKKMEELDNMTLAEIKAMKEEQRAERTQDRENTTLGDLKQGHCMMMQGKDSPIGPGCDDGGFCLLTMDLSKEELEKMTLGDIKELKQKKMQELDNMTLAELKALHEEQMQKMDNMTLAELQEKAELLKLVGGPHCLMGFQGEHPCGSGMGDAMGMGCPMGQAMNQGTMNGMNQGLMNGMNQGPMGWNSPRR